MEIFLKKLTALVYVSKKSIKNNVLLHRINLFSYILHVSFITVFSLILAIFTYYYLLSLRYFPAAKVLFSHFILLNFVYLLFSGFVFFFKKYRFNRFTSVIQRFWKRSYILFWLLESAIFTIFLYLTLNASEEPFYMYDQIKYNKTHLYSWRAFILLAVLYLFLILFTYMCQYSLKWTSFSTTKIYLILITLLLLFLVSGEFYQFYHIIGFYTNLLWVYDYDEGYWTLEMEFRRTRLVNNYVVICLLAKFWHLVFIAGFWLFFTLRALEVRKIGHLALSANLQNFIILYLMLWLYMYPWFKYIFRKFLHINYSWFAVDQRHLAFNIFLYLTLNASEEPFYRYDQIKYNKAHLYSWRAFILLAILYLFLILFTYMCQYSLKWTSFSTTKIYLILITLLLLFLVSGEFYQFYHIIGFYTNLLWVYDYDEGYWTLEMEFRRTRLVNNYVVICLLAKFWHLVFIAGFWLFFTLRALEVRKIGHLALSANLQNFIILYLMLWLYMYPWFKYIFRKFLHINYSWFAVDQRHLALNIFLFDAQSFFRAAYHYITHFFCFKRDSLYGEVAFFFWIDATNYVSFDAYKKHIIRSYIINNFLYS